MGILSIGLLALATRKVSHPSHHNSPSSIPLMGVMGAFIFAAQMINFSIPATGSSGHLIGGILLSAVLGRWAALLTLSCVLVLQCLIFADGGLLALGCNIFNMAVLSCLVAYPLFFKGIVRSKITTGRIITASFLSSVFALLLGAFAVTIETEASAITVLPFSKFILFMLPIHLVIGLGEGLATSAVLLALNSYNPQLLRPNTPRSVRPKAWIAGGVVSLLIAASFSWLASSNPDGLEWAINKLTGKTEVEHPTNEAHLWADKLQSQTALMPDYDTSYAGIVGSGCILLLAWGIGSLSHKNKSPKYQAPHRPR